MISTPPTEPAGTTGPKRWSHPILWLVVGIFATYIGLNTVMLWVTMEGPPDLVSEDYYEGSKKVDQVIAKREASRRLGWDVKIIPGSSGAEALSLWITERGGAPLTGLRGEVRAYRPSDSTMDQVLPLRESQSQPGLYVASSTHPGQGLGKGLWELTVKLGQGETDFTSTIRHVVK